MIASCAMGHGKPVAESPDENLKTGVIPLDTLITRTDMRAHKKYTLNSDQLINYSGLGYTMSLIGGKHKMLILFCLLNLTTARASRLRSMIAPISINYLRLILKQMENDGLIVCKKSNHKIPRVEFSLTKEGKSLKPVLTRLCSWGVKHGESKSQLLTIEGQ